MHRLLIAGGILLAGLCTAGPLCGLAQEANAPAQGSTQQQPPNQASGEARSQKEQKKPDGKTQKRVKTETKAPAQAKPSSSSSGQAARPAAEENPFPEQVSRDAAKSAEPAPASSNLPASPMPSTADGNPFPEAVSRSAAKAAGSASDDSPESQSPNQPNQPNQSNRPPALPPGVSSSQASALTRDSAPDINANGQGSKALEVTNVARAKKDTQVGNYYLAAGNPQGSYLRYRDALASDPTNVDAIFGLAEAARQLHKFAEAERNYQTYLAVLPNGPKAKEAAKALHSLAGKK